MSQQLPPFEPVTLDELRRIWETHPDRDIRRLTLEIHRYRSVLKEIDSLIGSTQRSWDDAVGGHLVALYLLNQALLKERLRVPPP